MQWAGANMPVECFQGGLIYSLEHCDQQVIVLLNHLNVFRMDHVSNSLHTQ